MLPGRPVPTAETVAVGSWRRKLTSAQIADCRAESPECGLFPPARVEQPGVPCPGRPARGLVAPRHIGHAAEGELARVAGEQPQDLLDPRGLPLPARSEPATWPAVRPAVGDDPQ